MVSNVNPPQQPAPFPDLTHARERVESAAREIANLMGVTRYQIVVTAHDADSPIGTAFTVPSERIIYIALSTANHASDEELRGTLAHEFGHLLATYPRWTLHRESTREGLFFLSGIAAVMLALACDINRAPTWAWTIPIGISLLLGVHLVESLAYARWRRRLELSCDAHRAHALGTTGLTAFEHDPWLKASPIERFFAPYPSASARVNTIRRHALREGCDCG